MAILNYGVGGVVFGKQSEAAQQGVQRTRKARAANANRWVWNEY
jgi:hypothetical protein